MDKFYNRPDSGGNGLQAPPGMNMFKGLRMRLHKKRLNRELRKLDVDRSSTSMDNANSIGILLDGTDMERVAFIMKYVKRLEKKGKEVTLLTFYENKGDQTKSAEGYHYNLKDLNWVYIPQKSDIKLFMNKRFDILINLMDGCPIHAAYIMAMSNARFRIGRYARKIQCYDLMIDDKKKDIVHFIGLVDMYLGMFNHKPKHEVQPV